MNTDNADLIRLLIIEDNATIVLAALRNFFRPGRDQIQVTQVAENVEQVINQIPESDFDVIILDLFIPYTTPIHNIQSLQQKFPGKPVVVYSSMDSKIWRRKMWELGASGYVHKNDGRDILKKAIQDAFNGKVVFNEEDAYERTKSDPARAIYEHTLSTMEKEILTMLVDGRKYKEIAQSLQLNTTIVDSIIKRLREKFNTRSTPQLIHLLTEQGLL
jgi:DNA-binding NarL/FixJ family response regulator